MDIAVFGGSEFTLGFMLAGIRQVFTVEEKEEKEGKEVLESAERMLEELLAEKETGVVIIDDRLLRQLGERMQEKVERSVRPVFVPVSTDASQETLRRMIIKSIGVDLIGNERQ